MKICFPVSGVLAVICLATAAGCTGEVELPAAPTARVVDALVVGDPAPAALSQWPARVEAGAQARLAFQVSGKIIERPIKEGDVVKQGQVLARLDTRRFQNALDAGQADLTEAEKQLQRFAALLKKKAIAKDVYDKQKAAYNIAAANLTQLHKNVEDATLRAPFSGRVAATLVENFQSVEAKQPILRLENIARLDLVGQLSEQVAPQLSPADMRLGIETGWVVFDAAPERRFPVTLKEYQTTADPQTQTYRVTLTLPAPKGLGILPGMTATVIDNTIRNDARAGFNVPASALNADQQLKPYVWLVNPDQQTVTRRRVTVSTLTGKFARVLEGIQAGDTVVIRGAPYLLEGMSVKVRQSAAAGEA